MVGLLVAGRRAATVGYASGRLRGVSRSIRFREVAIMSQVEKEIHEQPEALERLLRDGREIAEEIAARVRAFAPRFVWHPPAASSATWPSSRGGWSAGTRSSSAISDDPGVLGRARAALPLPPGVPEWVSPMVAVVPGQIWAVALARTRGLDPDQPRGLSKVTETK